MYRRTVETQSGDKVLIMGEMGKADAFAGHLAGLTGDEKSDRLTIQRLLDAEGTGLKVSYSGNTVYPAKRLTNELRRMRKTGNIEKMSKMMYEYLSMHFDLAHYNMQGYIDTYGGRYDLMLQGIGRGVENYRYSRFTDIVKIAMDSGLMSDAEMAIDGSLRY